MRVAVDVVELAGGDRDAAGAGGGRPQSGASIPAMAQKVGARST
jgi:hypothetical protein